MGNNASGIKKFLQNKNTVTVVGVVAAVLVLFIGYNIRVKSAINPITVPYAKQTINAGTQITESMVGTMQVPPAMLKGNVLRTQSQVIDKYTRSDSIIPEGSLFYSTAVVEEDQLPTSILLKYPKGYVLYNMSVNTTTTYGNSIYPENYIDIYLKAVNKVDNNSQITEDADKIMLGKLIENVKVLAVKDSQGRHVFENSEESRTPAVLIFGVNDELNILLRKASYMSSFSVVLFPVPHGVNGASEVVGATAVSSQTLKDFINANTVPNDELVTPVEPVEGE